MIIIDFKLFLTYQAKLKLFICIFNYQVYLIQNSLRVQKYIVVIYLGLIFIVPVIYSKFVNIV
jgi:hypothetical protein